MTRSQIYFVSVPNCFHNLDNQFRNIVRCQLAKLDFDVEECAAQMQDSCPLVGNASNDIIVIARASVDENSVVPDAAVRLPIAVLTLGILSGSELETISHQSMRGITSRPTYLFVQV